MAEKRFDRNDYQMYGTCNNREDVLMKMSLFNKLLDTAEDVQNQLDAEKKHSECLQAELEESQKTNFKIDHDSDRIVIQRDAEPIDIAAALIHSDWINLGDLQEIAEHLQAAYKNSWGE